MYRKLQKTPTGTYFITLPKNWVEFNNIKQGDLIDIEIRRDGALIIYPLISISRSVEDRINIKYIKGAIEAIKDTIMSAYLLGYKVIDVISEEGYIEPNDREEIRKLTHFFMGLEILDESDNKITIQSILDPSHTDPTKLLKRMAYLVEDMIKEGFTALINNDKRLAKIVSQRDEEVNRVYFLLIRVLRGALRNPSLADKYMLRPIEYLDYRVAAKIIESLGDIITTIGTYINENPKNQELNELLDMILRVYKLSIDLFFERKEKLKREFEKLHERIFDYLKKLKDQYTEIVELLKAILRETIDIVDLVVLVPQEKL